MRGGLSPKISTPVKTVFCETLERPVLPWLARNRVDSPVYRKKENKKKERKTKVLPWLARNRVDYPVYRKKENKKNGKQRLGSLCQTLLVWLGSLCRTRLVWLGSLCRTLLVWLGSLCRTLLVCRRATGNSVQPKDKNIKNDSSKGQAEQALLSCSLPFDKREAWIPVPDTPGVAWIPVPDTPGVGFSGVTSRASSFECLQFLPANKVQPKDKNIKNDSSKGQAEQALLSCSLPFDKREAWIPVPDTPGVAWIPVPDTPGVAWIPVPDTPGVAWIPVPDTPGVAWIPVPDTPGVAWIPVPDTPGVDITSTESSVELLSENQP
ncbi:hypothetical protein NDU88_006481 [Pleurodeles waltl]|uniref:Uncharacterized protein n=1 Tax=Pleurodeles waltl TaxID=8319 RepID=A0AAV7QHS9_PLEWA|nr:hypothetical protein NDU88_006481 [Pleurodeles waltl]